MRTTTIQVQGETKALLDKLKWIPEEPYDKVIVRLCLKALKESEKQ